MWRILTRSFYEAIVQPCIALLAGLFIVGCLCWPALLISVTGAGQCTGAATIILTVCQVMWWLICFCVSVLMLSTDSRRRDLSADSDCGSIVRPD